MTKKKLTREQEIAERQYRRLSRYVNSLPPDKRQLTEDELASLKAEGLCDAEGNITPDGELKLHQLELRKWMADQAKKSKKE